MCIRDRPGTTLKFIAGVTAACSGGAVLGAPLSHDFAVISLSAVSYTHLPYGFEIESRPYEGTVVTLRIPLEKGDRPYVKSIDHRR